MSAFLHWTEGDHFWVVGMAGFLAVWALACYRRKQ